MKVSIIIRTKNAEKTIGQLFKKLQEQTLRDFEVILVDTNSTDKTVEIAKNYKVDKIISISDSEFTHPHSINLGVQKADGELVVITNGHCIPMSEKWLEDGLKNFGDPKVAAIDGHYMTGYVATDYQKDLDRKYESQLNLRKENEWITNTNSIIRKNLWLQYPFDETLPECEDYDWAKEMIARGYKIIKDPAFNVYHLHPLTKEEDLRRKENWKKICEMIDKRVRPYGQYLT